jgi:hypothetical protein
LSRARKRSTPPPTGGGVLRRSRDGVVRFAMKTINRIRAVMLVLILLAASAVSGFAIEETAFEKIFSPLAERELASETFLAAFDRINDGFLARQGKAGDVSRFDGAMYHVSYVYDDFIFRYDDDFSACIDPGGRDYWEIPIYDKSGSV